MAQQLRQLGEVRRHTAGLVFGRTLRDTSFEEVTRSKRRSTNGISTAPYTGDLELAVIEKDGPHTVGFPCHRVVGGWIAAETNKWIKIRPTHWRVWPSPVKKT
jgi:hypothetical protein